MKIKILESASSDLKKGYSFYESKSAGIHNNKYGKCRLLSKRFPFAIYYDIVEEMIIIYAVLDCRQEPKQIEIELKKNGKPTTDD